MEQWLLPCAYAFFASLGFGIIFQIRGGNLWLSALGGMLGWFVYLLFDGFFMDDILQYFLAAAAVSVFSELMAIVRRAPVTVILVAAIIPLVPGGLIYQTMMSFLEGNSAAFLELGVYTFKIAGAIALGIMGTSSLIRFFRYNYPAPEQ